MSRRRFIRSGVTIAAVRQPSRFGDVPSSMTKTARGSAKTLMKFTNERERGALKLAE